MDEACPGCHGVAPSPRRRQATGHPGAHLEDVHGATLLGGTCWVCSLRLDTVEQRDLPVFRGLARCPRPDLIPTSVDLLIPDPVSVEAESLPVKRGLIYPSNSHFWLGQK
jgi:hypothetical protein